MNCLLVLALCFVAAFAAPLKEDEVNLLAVEFDPADECTSVLSKAVSLQTGTFVFILQSSKFTNFFIHLHQDRLAEIIIYD